MQTSFHNNKEKTEVEAKFVCPDGLGLNDFLAAVSAMDFKYTRENPCFQRDVYLDTPNYTLLTSDAALRIRQRGESYVGAYKSCVKQLDTIFERKEFEWTLSNEETRLWTEEKKPTIPPIVIEKLHLQGQDLRKVLVVETQRYTATIIGNDGFKAELTTRTFLKICPWRCSFSMTIGGIVGFFSSVQSLVSSFESVHSNSFRSKMVSSCFTHDL